MSPSVGTLHQETPLKLVAKITPKDIRNGVKLSTNDDPIARALTRAARKHGIEVADVQVIGEQAEMWAYGYGNSPDTIDYIRFEPARPERVLDFIIDFDYGFEVKPMQITFTAREIVRGQLD